MANINLDKVLSVMENNKIKTTTVINRFMGDKQLMEECFNIFFEDKNVAALQECIEKKDYISAKNIVENIRDAAYNLSIEKLIPAVDSLRKAIKNEQQDKIKSEYICLIQQLDNLKKNII